VGIVGGGKSEGAQGDPPTVVFICIWNSTKKYSMAKKVGEGGKKVGEWVRGKVCREVAHL